MARSDAVWGIDIGNCSLKALRCRAAEEPNRVIADAFDYIEYPKILTQPGAEPAELIHDALRQFLSRNSVRGDEVAISVSGQSGLARFIKLPPVEARKIPDIVRYEARQQIPFDLNDVIWDYQRMGGGAEEEGFVLETEIGLFAMKRDQVFRALEPFKAVGIDVDHIQLTPLALFNFMVCDQLTDLPSPDEYDPDNPPPSIVVLSMGTDASDLVVTNGFRVWQRSIPLGGSHFTKALTKELKLTFAKAEHLKRNAATAEDPKAVFQAMRPVFNDLLTEIQRSIGYFASIDRAAKIERVLAFGNPIKLPGLRRYLAQGLGIDVARLEAYQNLVGPEVLNAPAFQENQLCFPVCYGLGLQGLRRSPLRTNLLPREILKDRLINAKKPWAVAAAAVLLLGCTVSMASLARALASVDPARFQQPQAAAKQVIDQAKGFKSSADQLVSEFKNVDTVGKHVVENVEGRLRWLELLKAISVCLPSDPSNQVIADVTLRNQLYVDSLECQAVPSVKAWVDGMAAAAALATGSPSGTAAMPGSATYPGSTTTPDTTASAAADGSESQDPGWVITLRGHHFHNPLRAMGGFLGGSLYVESTLMRQLREGVVFLPTNDPTGPQGENVPLKELGISNPVLVNPQLPYDVSLANPFASAGERGGAGPMPGRSGAGTSMPSGYPGPSGPMAGGSRPSGYPSGGGFTPGGSPAGYGPSGMAGMAGMVSPGSGMPARSPMGLGMPAAQGTGGTDDVIWIKQMDFTVQFAWQPVPRSQRLKNKQAPGGGEAAAPAAATAPAGPPPTAAGPPPAPGGATPTVVPAAPAPAGPPPTAAGAPPTGGVPAPGVTPGLAPQPVQPGAAPGPAPAGPSPAPAPVPPVAGPATPGQPPKT